MVDLSWLTGNIKELTSNLKLQTAAVGALIGLIFALEGLDWAIAQSTILSLLSFFLITLFFSLGEKISAHLKARKEKRGERLVKKFGDIGKHQYTDIHPDLWIDSKWPQIGWQILKNDVVKNAFLKTPCCVTCKSDFLYVTNRSRDGFVLRCPSCSIEVNIDDIGEARHVQNALLQGEIRKNYQKFFPSVW